MPWRRPAELPGGQVWLRFQGKGKDGTPGKMYQVRDLEDKYKQECIDLMLETFLRDEPLCQVLGIPSDAESVSVIRANWEGYISQGVSLACFSEEGGRPAELVGFNIILVRHRGEEEEDFDSVKGTSWRKLLKTLLAAEALVDVYQRYGVDIYLTSSGLTVKPEYRGQNIGARIMEARKHLCKALGLKAVETVFTAKTSQVLAAKCGYELLATLDYKDMRKYGIDLSGCSTPTAEVRGIKFDFED